MKLNNKLKEFSSYMQILGATKPEKAWQQYQWQVETQFGPLEISLHRGDFTASGKPRCKYGNLVSIFCQFQDFEKAKDFLAGCYKQRLVFTAKLNFHTSGGENEVETWNSNFERFKSELEKILLQ